MLQEVSRLLWRLRTRSSRIPTSAAHSQKLAMKPSPPWWVLWVLHPLYHMRICHAPVTLVESTSARVCPDPALTSAAYLQAMGNLQLTALGAPELILILSLFLSWSRSTGCTRDPSMPSRDDPAS